MKKLLGSLGVIGVVMAVLVGPSGTTDAQSAQVPKVAVAGTPVAGSVLTVAPAAWGNEPNRRTYEWLRDGEGDVLGDDTSYTLSAADVGHTMVVVERVWFTSGPDETSSVPVAVTQAGPAAVPPPAPAPAAVPAVNLRRPTIKGTAKVGRTLKVRSKGRWDAPGHSYRYQWLRNGTKIAKATRTSYKLTRKDRSKKISLRVYARKAGLPTVTATSSRTSKVR